MGPCAETEDGGLGAGLPRNAGRGTHGVALVVPAGFVMLRAGQPSAQHISLVTLAISVLLLVLYNVAFVLPLLVILMLVLFAGERADPWLQRGGAWLQRRWPVVLAGLLLFVGGVLTGLGGTGLLKQ